MVTIGEVQFGGMIAMGALTLTQILQVPRRVTHHPVYGWSRWLMASSLALLTLQFFIQYLFGFRQMGVTQAVFINILFFMPSALAMSLAILFVQRQGNLTRGEWMMGWRVYFVTALVLIITLLADGVPFKEFSPALLQAEYVAAILYLIIQLHYFILHYREYKRMRRAVSEYYDRDREDLLRWMGLSVTLLALGGLFVPFVIFSDGWPLVIFSVFFFCTIYYCASSFHSYGISLDAQRVEEAEQSLKTDEAAAASSPSVHLAEPQRKRVEKAAEKWTEEGRFREPNLTLTVVASEMKLQRYVLKAWLQETDYGKLSTWLNHLRTEDAKRIMTEHPEWSLDTVAEQCGFGSRQYFHKVFHSLTGITPTHFIPA